MTPTQGTDASRELRQRLLDAAVELLREPDEPLSLREVAERAGKSRTAPYLVFGKGEEGGVTALRIAVAAEGARLMEAAMRDAYDPDAHPVAALKAVSRAFLGFVEENQRLFLLMYGSGLQGIAELGEERFRAHEEFVPLVAHRGAAGNIVEDIIRAAQDRGILRPDSEAPRAGSDATDAEPLSRRYLQVAWATMIGVSVLRGDDVLHAVEWNIDLDRGAAFVMQAVFGPDRGPDADPPLEARTPPT